MSLSRNYLAGLTSSVWSVLLTLIVVPFYLKYLGIEAYGLVGFFVTTQALLQLLEAGMSSTINREVARGSAAGNLKEAGKLLHSFAIIYWSMAGVIALLIMAVAPLIAAHWLQPKNLSQQTIEHAVMLMGIVVACRFPIALYQGALVGAQRIVVSSSISMVMITLGNLGALAVLAFVSPTIGAFFAWQACVGIVYTIVMRLAAWRVIGRTLTDHFDLSNVKRVLNFSLGVGGLSIAGLVLTQVDKVILSKTIGLESFGRYMLATMVAGSLYLLIVPTFNIIYPRFSSLVMQNAQNELLKQYSSFTHLLATMLFPTAMMIILLSQPLVQLWTGNAVLAADVAPLASFILVGYALHGVMYVPYALMLAQGDIKAMYTISISLILVSVPLTIVLSLRYGAVGGAMSQLLLFITYILFGTWIAHKKILKGYAQRWLSKDVGVSFGISILIGVAGYFIMPMMGELMYIKILSGFALWGVATLLSVLSAHSSRSLCVRYWNQYLYR